MVNFQLSNTATYSLDKNSKELEKTIAKYIFSEYIKDDSLSNFLGNIDRLSGTEENFKQFVSRLDEIIVDLETRTIASIVNDEDYGIKNLLDFTDEGYPDNEGLSPIDPSLLNYSIIDLDNPNIMKKVSGFGSFATYSSPTVEDLPLTDEERKTMTDEQIEEIESREYANLGRILLEAVKSSDVEKAEGKFKKDYAKSIEVKTKDTVRLRDREVAPIKLNVDLENKFDYLKTLGISEIVRRKTKTQKIVAIADITDAKGALDNAAKELFSENIEAKGGLKGKDELVNNIQLNADSIAKIILLIVPSVLDVDIKNKLTLKISFSSKGDRKIKEEKSHNFITDGLKKFKKSIDESNSVNYKERVSGLYKKLEKINNRREDSLLNDEDLKEAKEVYKNLKKLDSAWTEVRRMDDKSAVNFMSVGFTDAIPKEVSEVAGFNEVFFEILHTYTELKFTQEPNLKFKDSGDKEQRRGLKIRTERPLNRGKEEEIAEYSNRMASYGLPHLKLWGGYKDNNTQRGVVSDFINEILGHYDDLEEELAELKEKVI